MSNGTVISTLEAFVSRILQYRDEWAQASVDEPELWFRGVKRGSLTLLPGAYWREQCDEESLFLSFKAATPSYVVQRPANDWEWYFLAQHYGLPTRLLDWSESPLTALYFALTQAGGACISPDFADPPSVWVMDPASLNQATHRLSEGYLFVPDERRLTRWLPPHCGRGKQPEQFSTDSDFKDNSKPVAIFPVRYNPRLVAQRGVFTVHGTQELPIDEVFRVSVDAQRARIAKIVIDPAVCNEFLRDLAVMGVNQTSLFPEPSSVANDLIRLYGVK